MDLTKALKKYQSGWVAIDETKKRVIAHAKDFTEINKKVRGKKNVFIMAAAKEYFGFIT
ncbi:hypothetical protein HY041_00615 [Candidatus Roizmanbacteria bacterium]|nr:hypothetical protein [Candidatus Roizmanbacteria bacterium]